MSLTLTRKYYEGEVAKLAALRDKITATKGSAAKRLKDATDTALGQHVSLRKDDVPKPFPISKGDKDGFYVANLGDIAQYVVDVSEWAANLRDETVSALLKSAPSSNLEVLTEQYNSQREMVLALRIVLGQSKVDVSDIEIPALRKGGGGRPAGTRNTGTKSAHFYRILSDGTKVDQSDGQDKLSSMAWYFGAKIVPNPESTTNQGRGVPADVLTKYLNSQGVDSPNGKAWTLVSDGVTYGMEVLDPNSDKGEEE